MAYDLYSFIDTELACVQNIKKRQKLPLRQRKHTEFLNQWFTSWPEENVNKYPSWFLRQLQRACLSKSHPGSLTKVLSTLLDDFNSQHIYLIYPVCGFLSDSEYDNLSMYSICLSIVAWRYIHKFCKALSLFSCKPFFFL